MDTEDGKGELGNPGDQGSPTAFRNRFAHLGLAELFRTMGTWEVWGEGRHSLAQGCAHGKVRVTAGGS